MAKRMGILGEKPWALGFRPTFLIHTSFPEILAKALNLISVTSVKMKEYNLFLPSQGYINLDEKEL